jgi:hypothetical protein
MAFPGLENVSMVFAKVRTFMQLSRLEVCFGRSLGSALTTQCRFAYHKGVRNRGNSAIVVDDVRLATRHAVKKRRRQKNQRKDQVQDTGIREQNFRALGSHWPYGNKSDDPG